MIYYNVKETAELWKISPQMVRRFCLDGRVTGAILTDKGWIIPDLAEKPDKLGSEAEITLPDITRKLQSQKRNRKKRPADAGRFFVSVSRLAYSQRAASLRFGLETATFAASVSRPHSGPSALLITAQALNQ